MKLKLSAFDNIDQDILQSLRDGRMHNVIISTTKKKMVPDRKDPRYINSLDNVKLVLEKQSGGVIILIGNLQYDFRPPIGGSFF